MRAISLSVLFILAVEGFAHAATFQCEFIAKAGSQSDFSCPVDTTASLTAEVGKCRQDFSATLFGECDGRSPGGVNQLICYFASPANPPNLVPTSIIDQAGVYAVAIEWTDWTVGQSIPPIVFDYKDGQNSRTITCTPN